VRITVMYRNFGNGNIGHQRYRQISLRHPSERKQRYESHQNGDGAVYSEFYHGSIFD
jgi:hypothetical protein